MNYEMKPLTNDSQFRGEVIIKGINEKICHALSNKELIRSWLKMHRPLFNTTFLKYKIIFRNLIRLNMSVKLVINI